MKIKNFQNDGNKHTVYGMCSKSSINFGERVNAHFP